MATFRKESLEQLRHRIDLVDVIGAHIDLKPSGSSYKGLCPFHDEKTPSFMIQRGDTHYHCFGCGAHGDAIEFLMSRQKISFVEAVEQLAARFQVTLEYTEEESKGPDKRKMKEAMQFAAEFFHFFLLNAEEGREPLAYLNRRGIDLNFIERFALGWAPGDKKLLALMKKKGFDEELLIACGLLREVNGRVFEFFSERITFPITDAAGAVIGFSARKIKESTFGGKYINTPETPLFKKSKVLFGLHESRRRIAKEKKAMIVEGQIDALRLISEGFDYTVAGQGTAFGAEHVAILLQLGVQRVDLALDGDEAGAAAMEKIGDLFQQKGVEVQVISLPSGADADSFLRQQGVAAFQELLAKSVDYLTFLFERRAAQVDLTSPAAKNHVVQSLISLIRRWENEVMVHESLKKVARLAQLPEDLVGVGQRYLRPPIYIKKSDSLGIHEVDPHYIIECDCLRWLIKTGKVMQRLVELATINLKAEDFKVEAARELFVAYMEAYQAGEPIDRLSLKIRLEHPAAQNLLMQIDEKKINLERAEQYFIQAVQKLLERNWMEKCEQIQKKIMDEGRSDEENFLLLREFQSIKNNRPVVSI